MDLTTWMTDELTDMRDRLRTSVIDIVPVDRHKERADGGGSTITSLLWHLARHQDIAVNVVVRNTDQVLESFRRECGASRLGPGDGLAEAESQEITDQLDAGAVVAYYDAVCAATAQWLPTVGGADLDTIPDAARALGDIGVEHAAVPWLYNMWHAKSVGFHIRWEAIAHGVTHTGEMVSMRNRMGLSPF